MIGFESIYSMPISIYALRLLLFFSLHHFLSLSLFDLSIIFLLLTYSLFEIHVIEEFSY